MDQMEPAVGEKARPRTRARRLEFHPTALGGTVARFWGTTERSLLGKGDGDP